MKCSLTIFKSLVSLCFILCLGAQAAIVPLSDPEGMERLSRSKHRADFGKLMAHYRNQYDRLSCGPVVGAIVLNALRYNTERAPVVELPKKSYLAGMPEDKEGKKFDPRLRMYTPENFVSVAAAKIKTLDAIYAQPFGKKKERSPGIGLEELRRIFSEAHGLKVTKINVGTKETARNRKEVPPQDLPKQEYERIVTQLKSNLAEVDNYVVVNYSRSVLGQPGTGHISPVAAYDEKSDSFLVLDVNPFGGPQGWIPAKDLMDAMNTTDSEENRGLLLLSEN